MASNGRAFHGVNLGLLAPAMSLLLAAAAAEPPGLSRDFDAAVARIKHRSSPFRTIGFDDYAPEAAAIAKAYGPSAAQPLGHRVIGPDRVSSTLALMTLASLCGDPAGAKELSSCLRGWNFRDPTACMALTYATPSAAMAVVDEVMVGRVRQPGVLRAISTLARFFGEPGRDAALEALVTTALTDGTPLTDYSDRREIAVNLVALRQRLARPAGERLGWSKQDMAVWRAVHSMPGSRGLNADRENRTAVVCAATRFTPSFLKDRLAATTLDFNERALLLKIVRDQRQAELVPELAKMFHGVQPFDHDVYDALAFIGTREALASLEKFVAESGRIDVGKKAVARSPEQIEASDRERLAINLCEILSKCGDRKTLDFMENLAEDESRPASIRAASAKARDLLRRRIQSRP